MNRLWNRLKAFTLAELVIVMLVIAVVAGVSIKITKAKLDSVISYTYYSAYNTLRSVAGEMMADSDDTEEYGDLSYNKNKSLVDKFIDKYLIPKSYAAFDITCMEKRCESNQIFNYASCRCENVACRLADRKACIDDGGTFNASTCLCTKKICDQNQRAQCIADGNTWNDLKCTCLNKITCNIVDATSCTSQGGLYDLNTCTCSLNVCDNAEKNMCITEGGSWNDTTCQCSLSNPVCSAADALSCTNNGGTWNEASCSCTGQCTLTQSDCSTKQVFDRDNCRCRDKLVTLPKTGEEFCKSFVNHTNTISSSCNGKNSAAVSTAVNAGDFKDLAPDIVLRNGMKVYNAKNDYVKITALEGNSPIVYNNETNPLFIDSVFTAHSIIREKAAFLFRNLLEQPVMAAFTNTGGVLKYCSQDGKTCELQCPDGTDIMCHSNNQSACRCPSSGDDNNGGSGDDGSTPAPNPDDVDGTPPGDLNEEGLPSNLNEHGYIVYIDVDGDKGESILYEDVFPFYVTLEGRVIPAYRDGVEAGGNSIAHLTVSIQYDTYNSGDRRENWMTPKGTDFRHAACMSGYVTANNYCTGVNDAQIATKRALCTQTSSDCRVKVNKPLRF